MGYFTPCSFHSFTPVFLLNSKNGSNRPWSVFLFRGLTNSLISFEHIIILAYNLAEMIIDKYGLSFARKMQKWYEHTHLYVSNLFSLRQHMKTAYIVYEFSWVANTQTSLQMSGSWTK